MIFFFLTLALRGPFHRQDFKQKKYWGTALISEKLEVLYAELSKRVEAATSNYLQQAIFCNIFILCLQLRIIRRSDQSVQFINFPSQIFFNDINRGCRAAILKKNYLWLLPFYMAVAIYCYYEKVLRTMRTAIVSYLLKQILPN